MSDLPHIVQMLLAGLAALAAAVLVAIGVEVAAAIAAWVSRPGSEMDGYTFHD